MRIGEHLLPDIPYHFCSESSELLNAYIDNMVTDTQGYATVHLQDCLESVKREFQYPLTIVDGAVEEFVLARVVRKIQNHRFVIHTNQLYVEFSGRVEAISNEPWALRYGFQT